MERICECRSRLTQIAKILCTMVVCFYIGWLHCVLITGVIAFGADGTIIWARHNCPGSWNDGRMSQGFREKLADPRLTLDNHGAVADSAFPTGNAMFTKIMTPLKKGDLERIPISPPQLRERALTRSAQLTSLRQTCEWGMGAVTKVYRVLLVKLPFAQDKRGCLIKNCFMLYNFRVRTTGISQIKSVFY